MSFLVFKSILAGEERESEVERAGHTVRAHIAPNNRRPLQAKRGEWKCATAIVLVLLRSEFCTQAPGDGGNDYIARPM